MLIGLLVFYALIYFQDLYWAFSAETMAILFVEVAMMYFAYKSTHRIFDAILVASLYPLCLLLVFFLENVVGLYLDYKLETLGVRVRGVAMKRMQKQKKT